jgi:hypothetical protein
MSEQEQIYLLEYDLGGEFAFFKKGDPRRAHLDALIERSKRPEWKGSEEWRALRENAWNTLANIIARGVVNTLTSGGPRGFALHAPKPIDDRISLIDRRFVDDIRRRIEAFDAKWGVRPYQEKQKERSAA